MRRLTTAVLLTLGLMISGLTLAMPGSAQTLGPGQQLTAEETTTPQIEPTSPEAVREMVSRLTDTEVRALLLERLDAVAQERAAAEAGGLGDLLAGAVGSAMTSVTRAVERVPNIPGGIVEGVNRFYGPRGALGTLHLLAVLLGALGLGYLAERAVPRLVPAALRPRPDRRPSGLGDTLGFLFRRLVIEAAGVTAFMVTAWAVMALTHPPEPISYLILTFFLFIPVLYVRVAAALGRFVLAPNVPAFRLLTLDDQTARFLHRSIVIFAGIVGLRAYTLSFLGGHGVDLGNMHLGFWLTLVVYGWLFYVTWRARAGLTRMLIDDDVTPVETALAKTYPYVSMAFIMLFWMVTEIFAGQDLWALLDGRLPLTLTILIFAPVADTAIRGLARHLVPIPANSTTAAEALALRTRRGFIRMGRVVALGAILLVLIDLWNVDFAAASMGPLAARIAAAVLEALGVLAIGYLVLEAVSLWIFRRLAAEMPAGEDATDEEEAGEGGGAGQSRLSTILPLLRRILQVAIITVTMLTALSVLGVSIAPLLAGVGIIGLAIGFGAQKLVADVVSGMFFLIDDAFRVGEYVEVDGTFGTVEQISVRSLRLRHHEGAVHTIPFGEIPKLTNYSRDWVIMKLRFTVPFDTDLQKVKKLFKKIGQEMAAEPAYAEDFLQPFKSQGVLEVDDVGLVLRGKFMAKPGRQWVLRKEIFARVQRVFEENDIQFARREVRVRIDGE
ncbi:MAG: mechanosensitive ion channel domain-containing protein, partial [Pseudomonadota bacterium]